MHINKLLGYITTGTKILIQHTYKFKKNNGFFFKRSKNHNRQGYKWKLLTF